MDPACALQVRALAGYWTVMPTPSLVISTLHMNLAHKLQVRRLAGGRVYTGKQARELGLVDELGGLQVGCLVSWVVCLVLACLGGSMAAASQCAMRVHDSVHARPAKPGAMPSCHAHVSLPPELPSSIHRRL